RQLNDPVPPVTAQRPDLSSMVDEVLARATAKPVDDRYGSVGEFVDDLAEALSPGPSAPKRADARGSATLIAMGTNPYKGLRAFQESDADDFFGRERLVDRLLEQLRQDAPESRFVAAVGPSGSGKSSVVRAGLLPRLRAGAIPGSHEWFITTMTPGANPFDELEAALSRVATAPVTGLVEVMRSDPRGIARAIGTVLPDETSELLLVVDQFEELFTLLEDEVARQRFIEGLHAAVTDPKSRLRVMLTIRADFWDRPLRYPEIARILERSAVTVVPLAADELEKAIVIPASRVGVELEAGLASMIVADVRDQPGGLPLMQYVLTELFDRNVSGLMRIDTYRELGGVPGALANRAEELFESADDDDRNAIQTLFTRLVTPGEGADDTRRKAPRSELAAAAHLIDGYGAARLLSFDRDPASREPTVEVAHEALIRSWPRLRSWIDEDRDGLRILRHMTTTARDWNERGRPEAELYRGGRLEAASAWAHGRPDSLTAVEREFLDQSDARARAEHEAELRTNRRLRRLLVGAAVFAVVSLIAGLLAAQQWSRANDETTRADERAAEAEQQQALAEESQAEALDLADAANRAAADATSARRDADLRRMASEVAVLAQENPALALLIAATLHEEDPGLRSQDALAHALLRDDGLLGFVSAGATYVGVAFTEDQLIARSLAGLEIWDLETRTVDLVEVGGTTGSLSVDADRGLAATGVDGTRLSIVDLTTGEEVATLDPGAQVRSLAWGPDLLAVGTVDGKVRIYDSDHREVEAPIVLPVRDRVQLEPAALAIAADGRSIFVGDQTGGALGYELGSPVPVWVSTLEDRFEAAGFEPPGKISEELQQVVAVAADFRGDNVLIDTVSNFSVVTMETAEPVATVVKSPSTTSPASVAGDRLLSGPTMYDVDDLGSPLSVLSGRTFLASALHPTGGIAAIAQGNEIELISLDGSGLVATAFPSSGADDAFLDADDSRLMVNFRRGGWDLWDVASGERLPMDFGPGFARAAFMPAGGLFAWYFTGESRFWTPDLEPVGSTAPENFFSIITNADLDVALMGTTTPAGQINVYDLSDERRLAELTEIADAARETGAVGDLADTVTQIVVDPSERWFVGVGTGIAGMYEFGTWEFRSFLDVGAPVANVAFSSDGTVVAAQRWDGQVHFLDVETLQPVAEPLDVGRGEPTLLNRFGLTFTSGDRQMVVISREGTQLWDLEERRSIGPRIPTSAMPATVSASGTKVVTGDADNVFVWDLDPTNWPELACQAAGRNMTREEWAQHGPQGEEYDPICDQWPSGAT
ncbi:MAG: hypothetical protein AAF480_13145, partial [Actinomycetota bacterium]